VDTSPFVSGVERLMMIQVARRARPHRVAALWLGAGLLCWRVVDRVFDTVDKEDGWAVKHRHALTAIAAGSSLAARCPCVRR
jgi:hypothetical protein